MKKRLVLGDVHGHYDIVEFIYIKELPDEVIILGDYCDSFTVDTEGVVDCWKKLNELKATHEKNNPGEFTLVLGNHDWHYITNDQQYSGWKLSTWCAMHDTLKAAWDSHLLKVAVVDKVNRTVYSHAGVTNTWLQDCANIAIEDIDDVNGRHLNFSGCDTGMYGNSKYQGPLWVRPAALIEDMYSDEHGIWKQIVGHTRARSGISITLNERGSLCRDDLSKAVLFGIDALPYEYIVEHFYDDGTLHSREVVQCDYDYGEKFVQ